MSREISMSMKRTTALFNEPGYGRVIFQESEGNPSKVLRIAIRESREAFWKAYERESAKTKEASK